MSLKPTVEHSTCVRRIDPVRGQHTNFPSDPFDDWKREGWSIVTATIRVDERGAEIYALLERTCVAGVRL